MGEVAAQFSEKLGRPVAFTPLPDDQAEAAMGYDMATMFKWFNKVGYDADIHALGSKYGIPLTSFSDYLNRVDF
ncbi:MAG: hypothetical protein V3U07_09960 [Nitrospirales bacterium]